MRRIPSPGLVRPAGSYAPGLLRWGPVSPRPIGRIPVQAFRQQVLSVPLVGGQGQTTVVGYSAASGSHTSPTVGTEICGVTPVAGTYLVSWSVTLSGTLSSNDANNFGLFLGAAGLATSVNPDIAGTYAQTPVTVTTPGGLLLSVGVKTNNATSGAVYAASIPGQTAYATISVGPQGLGNVWYPSSLTVQTTSGTSDTSTCNVYGGPAGVGVTLLGTFYPGTAGAGVASFALPSLAPGQYLIAEWTGGNPGDIASVNVVGTMNSVMPG